MSEWSVVGGPHQYNSSPYGDIDVGWLYDIRRGGEFRAIRVEVVGGGRADTRLAPECRQAVVTEGESAIASVLEQTNPPARILVTPDGLGRS